MKRGKSVLAVLSVIVFGMLFVLSGCGAEKTDDSKAADRTNTEASSTMSMTTTESPSTSMTTDTTESGTSAGESSPSSTESSGVVSSTPDSSRVSSSSTQTSGSQEAGNQETGEESGFYQNIRLTDVSMGIRILVNKKYKLPDNFKPSELVDIPSNYQVADGKEYKMEKEAAESFYQMSNAAWNESDGKIDLRIISGYRSASYQEWLYNHYVNTYGKENADSYSARPRHSEHETGLCCDINMVGMEFENMAAFQWLMENAADYGFILRYEKGKEHITGYIFKPWHWRYVGVETAQAVKESGLSYDEYYQQYLEGSESVE
ncbi:MAG: M15 family metallopeptidase [Bacillota bacterium]|nr:M15 family metallopeptidase [Bacillota bacterium]